jgi:hypothetical protein
MPFTFRKSKTHNVSHPEWKIATLGRPNPFVAAVLSNKFENEQQAQRMSHKWVRAANVRRCNEFFTWQR